MLSVAGGGREHVKQPTSGDRLGQSVQVALKDYSTSLLSTVIGAAIRCTATALRCSVVFELHSTAQHRQHKMCAAKSMAFRQVSPGIFVGTLDVRNPLPGADDDFVVHQLRFCIYYACALPSRLSTSRRHTVARGASARSSHSHCWTGSQDHLPAAYSVKRCLLDDAEVSELRAWISKSGDRTDFDGTPLSESDAAEGPVVRQFWGKPEAFVKRFPAIFQKVLDLKDTFGAACGLPYEELKSVSFAQDIRFITYRAGDSCPWHRDDPVSHFNVIFMLSEPEHDFTKGELMLHPGPCRSEEEDAHWVALQRGDAIIYSAPKTDHGVRPVDRGKCKDTTRTIFLVELRRRELAVRPAECADESADGEVQGN